MAKRTGAQGEAGCPAVLALQGRYMASHPCAVHPRQLQGDGRWLRTAHRHSHPESWRALTHWMLGPGAGALQLHAGSSAGAFTVHLRVSTPVGSSVERPGEALGCRSGPSSPWPAGSTGCQNQAGTKPPENLHERPQGQKHRPEA